MKNVNDEIIYSFRYGVSTKELAESIMAKLDVIGLSFELIQPSRFNQNKYIVYIENIDQVYLDAIYINKINQELGINKECFDFFIGITSKYQLGGLTVNPKVVDYIKIIGGELNFSYSVSL